MQETVELLIGPAPAWLELGPVEMRDGLAVRPVLGDWSHRAPCDRPPKYVFDQHAPIAADLVRQGPHEALEQRTPGKSMSLLKGIHSGAVAVLFNGPTLQTHNLFRIRTPIIGMNRTYAGHKGYIGPQPDYLCIIEECWFLIPEVVSHPGLINGGAGPLSDGCDKGHRALRSYRGFPFSFDLLSYGFVPSIPGSTGFMALQVAVWMGFTDIYCLGLDLGGDHFDGSKASQHFFDMARIFRRMAPLLADRGVRVTVCGSPKSHCDAFAKSSFEELVACA